MTESVVVDDNISPKGLFLRVVDDGYWVGGETKKLDSVFYLIKEKGEWIGIRY